MTSCVVGLTQGTVVIGIVTTAKGVSEAKGSKSHSEAESDDDGDFHAEFEVQGLQPTSELISADVGSSRAYSRIVGLLILASRTTPCRLAFKTG